MSICDAILRLYFVFCLFLVSIKLLIFKMNKSMNVTQKDLLVKFMKEHPGLNEGKFSSNFTFKSAQTLWEHIASELNSVPNGAEKDWKHWRKTWQDLKKNTKSKLADARRYAKGTGGGEPRLHGIPDDLMDIVCPTQVDGLNIEEIPITFRLEEESLELEVITEDSVELPNKLPSKQLVTGQNASVSTPISVADETVPLEHNYSEKENIKPKKMNKTTRLTKSLEMTEALSDSVSGRNEILANYYEKKVSFMEKQQEYYKQKLVKMDERLRIERELSTTLKEIKNILATQPK